MPSYQYEAHFTDSVLALDAMTAELAVGLSSNPILSCLRRTLLKSNISTKLSHIESWFFLTVYSKHRPSQTISLVYVDWIKGTAVIFFQKSLNFHLTEGGKYKFDELKIKYGTKPGDMLLVSLFSLLWKKIYRICAGAPVGIWCFVKVSH